MDTPIVAVLVHVPDVEAACTWYRRAFPPPCRGPMPIEDGQQMGQVRDPWGNCIGLRGPVTPPVTPAV